MLLFSLSLVEIRPIEKCLNELNSPNVLPGEREDIKRQVRNLVIQSSEDFFNFYFPLCYFNSPLKTWAGIFQRRCQYSGAVRFEGTSMSQCGWNTQAPIQSKNISFKEELLYTHLFSNSKGTQRLHISARAQKFPHETTFLFTSSRFLFGSAHTHRYLSPKHISSRSMIYSEKSTKILQC